jgi:hypothetical protein
MTLPLIAIAAVTAAAAAALGLAARQARRRGLDRWLPSYIAQAARRRAPRAAGPIHLILCVADHYEPGNGGVSGEVADRRVRRWVEDYPRLLGGFRDSDGVPPRQTFFFPLEQYDPGHLNALAGLCRQGYGEVEVHLHHDRETAEGLRRRLLEFKEVAGLRHGLLARDKVTGDLAYGFIHGDWALDNSRPDGRCCGVNQELDVLRETGCYADFTLPSAPDPTQTRKINSLYYARDDPRPKSHDRGIDVGAGPPPEGGLLMVQGPLVLDWGRRKWGVLPRVENGCIQANQPARIERLEAWLRARVQVAARPDWYFVKLHTHGAPEPNSAVLLGEPMARFHRELAARAAQDPGFRYHYVTAREMYNLIRAAEDGWAGDVHGARDYRLVSNTLGRMRPAEAGGVSRAGAPADVGTPNG